jgi:hypothetical protein
MPSVKQVMVGLHRVGIVGLQEAFDAADGSGLKERQDLLDVMMAVLTPLNYMPPSSVGDYREAVWRELMRHRGEDIRDLYSEIRVSVRGEPGPGRDRFVETLRWAFGEYELKPVVAFELPDPMGPNPQMLMDGEAVIKGSMSERDVKQTIRAQITDW